MRLAPWRGSLEQICAHLRERDFRMFVKTLLTIPGFNLDGLTVGGMRFGGNGS